MTTNETGKRIPESGKGGRTVQTVTLAAFVRRHWGACSTWTRGQLLDYVRWYQLRDLAFWHRDERGRIDALGFVRPVRGVQAGASDRWRYDSGGAVWFLDLVITTGRDFRRLLRGLFSQARLRLGPPVEVAWERWSRGRAACGFGMAQLMRRLLGTA